MKSFITSSDIMIRNAWYVAGFSEEFQTEKLQQQIITERPIVLWRTHEGRVVAFDDRCCHKRMPISAGRFIESGVLECAYHGLCFNSQGKCVRIPSQPDTPIPSRARLTAFPVVEQDGLVWIWPGDPSKVGDTAPPPTPELADPGWDRTTEKQVVPANAMFMIENLLDVSHLYPLHDGNIGNIGYSSVPMRMEVGQINGMDYVKTIREAENLRQSPDFIEMLGYEQIDGYNSQAMVGPGTILAERSVWPAGRRGDASVHRLFRSMHMFTPINRQSNTYRWAFVMPKGQKSGTDPNKLGIQVMREKVPPIVAQDIWAVVRQQQMCEVPDDDFEEMYLKSDAGMAKAREIVTRMQRAEADPASP
ncbi:MAG: Rieske 2Fe-2S domain-containing protein [Ramlibacter sp.]|nr:Rieske 2Fe-2S domain-containing protein [Ramlibacter sp.]